MWTKEQKTLLDGILDVIVPPSADGRVPGAGALGTADYLADRAANDDALADLIERGLDAAAILPEFGNGSFDDLPAEAQIGAVGRLEIEQPDFFEALLRHGYMGYYSRPDIRALFGLSAEPTQPGGYSVPPESPDLMAALTEPVVRRGVCYREC